MTMYDMSRVAREGNSTDGWNVTGTISFMNQPLLAMASEIATPSFSSMGRRSTLATSARRAYAQLKGNNKELMVIPGANHVDLYDNREDIPFDKLESFFGKNL